MELCKACHEAMLDDLQGQSAGDIGTGMSDDISVDQDTCEHCGAIPERLREAGRDMTILEAWQKVYDYFSAPDADFAYEAGDCRYRTAEGRKCAVGVLIPDDEYDGSRMEGYSICNGNTSVFGSVVSAFTKPEIKILERMQHAHDTAAHDADAVGQDRSVYMKQFLSELMMLRSAAVELSPMRS